MPRDSVQYEIRDDDRQSEVLLTGRLTFEGNEIFRQLYDVIDAVPPRAVTLDMRGIEFVDSAGLGMVLLLRDCATAKGGSLALRNPGGQVKRLLDLCHLHSLLPVID